MIRDVANRVQTVKVVQIQRRMMKSRVAAVKQMEHHLENLKPNLRLQLLLLRQLLLLQAIIVQGRSVNKQ